MGALIGLFITGQSINLMTLGGMSLAVGILVDMGTVVIENIHTQMAKQPSLARAGAGRHGGDDGADLAGHAVHPGRVSAVVPDGGGGRQPVRAAGHLGRLRHDHGVHSVDHLRAGAVDLDPEAARSRSRGRDRRTPGGSPSLASGSGYARWCGRVLAAALAGAGRLPGRGRPGSRGVRLAGRARRFRRRSMPASSRCASRRRSAPAWRSPRS